MKEQSEVYMIFVAHDAALDCARKIAKASTNMHVWKDYKIIKTQTHSHKNTQA